MIGEQEQAVLFRLALYQRANETGQAPDREGLLARNPDLVDDLTLFFDDGHLRATCGCCTSEGELTARLQFWTRAVNALSEEQVQVLIFGRLQRLTQEQIGARLGLAPDAVRRRLAQARDRLRNFADDDTE